MAYLGVNPPWAGTNSYQVPVLGGFRMSGVRAMPRKGRAQWAHLYKAKEWQRLRDNQLKRHPNCQCPHCQGKKLKADTADHKIAHKGDRRLFFDPKNLQSMAASCHNSRKQSQERGGAGFLKGCDEKGRPLSPDHEWNKEQCS